MLAKDLNYIMKKGVRVVPLQSWNAFRHIKVITYTVYFHISEIKKYKLCFYSIPGVYAFIIRTMGVGSGENGTFPRISFPRTLCPDFHEYCINIHRVYKTICDVSNSLNYTAQISRFHLPQCIFINRYHRVNSWIRNISIFVCYFLKLKGGC